MDKRIFVLAPMVCLSFVAVAQDTTTDGTMTPAFLRSIVGPPASAPLRGDELDKRTEEISRELRCPVCQGSSVGDSPSSTARHMKDQVRELLASGYSEEQCLAYFEAAYGEFVRLAPKAAGFNDVIWILPGALVVFGAFGAFLFFRRNASATRADRQIAASPRPVDELDPWIQKVRSMVDHEHAGEER